MFQNDDARNTEQDSYQNKREDQSRSVPFQDKYLQYFEEVCLYKIKNNSVHKLPLCMLAQGVCMSNKSVHKLPLCMLAQGVCMSNKSVHIVPLCIPAQSVCMSNKSVDF